MGNQLTEGDVEYLSWNEFDRAIYQLTKEIHGDHVINTVVGISRGGLPGAVLLSHMLGADVGVIDVNHEYDEDGNPTGDVEVGENLLPTEPETVLVFDDIVETGKTMQMAVSALPISNPVTASIHVDVDRDTAPDYWIVKTDSWIVYPWEVETI